MSKDKGHIEKFERYLKGKMTTQEAHDFERENLDDFFVQEALEGFEEQGHKRLNDVAEMKRKIAKRSTFSWLQIASAAIFLLVGSFAIYVALDRMHGNEQLALKEEVVKESSFIQPITDSIVTSEESIVSIEPKTEEIEKRVTQAEDSNLESELEVLADQTTDKAFFNSKDSNEKMEIAVEIEPTTKNIQLAQAKPQNSTDLPIIDKASREVPLAELAGKKSKKNAGAVSRSAVAITEEIVFEENSDDLINDNLVPIEPIIGWERYNQYILDSLRYPSQAKSAGVEGRVFIQVETNPKGEIIQSFVVKGIGSGCDEEALRLVRIGPKFKPDSIGGKGIIPVPFKIE